MKLTLFFCITLTLAMPSFAQGTGGPVNFQPSADLQKRILAPAPGPGATNQTKKAVIGRGKTQIDTGDPKNVYWTETLDLSGAGDAVSSDLLWDSSSKILYAFAHATLRCSHGKSVDSDILVAIYGKKNYLGKPAGSGWWMVDMQQDQCHAPQAGLYGCKFSAAGATLACGHAELDSRINDMAITEATRF